MSIVRPEPSPAPVCAWPPGRTCARRSKKELHNCADVFMRCNSFGANSGIRPMAWRNNCSMAPIQGGRPTALSSEPARGLDPRVIPRQAGAQAPCATGESMVRLENGCPAFAEHDGMKTPRRPRGSSPAMTEEEDAPHLTSPLIAGHNFATPRQTVEGGFPPWLA